jgi:3-methyladenine DNA glycosylase AlkD
VIGFLMMLLNQLKQQLKSLADPDQALQLQRYFKTGPGQYGEGDRFVGIRMPQLRRLVTGYLDMALADVAALLHTPIHEQRMAALLILSYQFATANEAKQTQIYNFYLDNTRWINNWDLVDVTVIPIVGAYLLTRSRKPLYGLAKSNVLWERRMAIVATHCFIKKEQFEDTLALADLLLSDGHDLIHKAVGWMVREVGKRDVAVMEAFLLARYLQMPRTMLRYAIEKLPEPRRQAYLKGRL